MSVMKQIPKSGLLSDKAISIYIIPATVMISSINFME